MRRTDTLEAAGRRLRRAQIVAAAPFIRAIRRMLDWMAARL